MIFYLKNYLSYFNQIQIIATKNFNQKIFKLEIDLFFISYNIFNLSAQLKI